MADAKVIAVVGATGAQGGELVRAIQRDTSGGFRARGLTRHPDSDKAKELVKLGAEVVAADLDDQSSLERAFKGAADVFCLTTSGNTSHPRRSRPRPRTRRALRSRPECRT